MGSSLSNEQDKGDQADDTTRTPHGGFPFDGTPGDSVMEMDVGSSENGKWSGDWKTGQPSDDVDMSSGGTHEIVPTVFRWEHGGRNVCITGTFNGWAEQIPMHRSGNDFSYIHDLPKGKHAYKFVVDDEWRYAPNQPTVADIEGNINNFIDVCDFDAFSEEAEAKALQKSNSSGNYGRMMPDIEEYTKQPPPLPPHLRHIILNKNCSVSLDAAVLPAPQHVALNHLYCTAIKDGMMVLGISQRYKQKFVTTVYYSLLPSS